MLAQYLLIMQKNELLKTFFTIHNLFTTYLLVIHYVI